MYVLTENSGVEQELVTGPINDIQYESNWKKFFENKERLPYYFTSSSGIKV